MPLPQDASSPKRTPRSTVSLQVGPQQIALALVRHPRARRYVLRLRPDGVARVTIPRGGSLAAAKAFAERNVAWLERQLQRLSTRLLQPVPWHLGSEFLFRGEMVRLEAGLAEKPGTIRFGNQLLLIPDSARSGAVQMQGCPAPDHTAFDKPSRQGDGEISELNLRPLVEKHLRRLAKRELPTRVFDLASLHQLAVRRVTVRDQKSRWGSCSPRGTISLNWRLLQTPAFVCDYIILHELMHLRHMNHSARFWREVGRVCPDYRMAELWLKRHSALLSH